MIHPLRPNEKLTNIIKKSGNKKLFSIELNPYKPIDFNLVAKMNPSFCSLTWIAKTRDPVLKDIKSFKPIMAAQELIQRGYTVLIHVPGIFYTKDQMKNILTTLKNIGVRNIFAMRGGGPWLKIENCDFPFAQTFIEFIEKEFNHYFDIVIAGFPQVHPATRSMEDEMYFLRQKVISGANIILTQASLTPERYIWYRSLCTKYAIDIPVIYGVLLMRSWNDFIRIKRMSLMIDKKVMRSALEAKREGRGKQHAREHTKHIIKGLLDDSQTIAVHIFTQNCLELTRNIFIETNVQSYRADSKIFI